jgi:sulfur-oxidizing protein SoxY
MKRRVFLKGTLASGTVAVALGAGLLTSGQVLASWPESAFGPRSFSDALKNLHKSDQLSASDKIEIEAPDIAENGMVVPITVKTTLGNVESIQVLVEKGNSPLTASFEMTPAVAGFVSTRIKMGQTSDVVAVVKSGGKLYSARKEVKVTIGGCGG